MSIKHLPVPYPSNRQRRAKTDPTETDEGNQVVVEGQREEMPPAFSTGNLDLTRTEDDVLPFTVFTARDIESSGAVDLREFLRTRLPQNLSDNNGMELDATGYQFTRNDQIEMRGWGAAETVFLLNGRRMAAEYQPTDTDAGNASPNLGGIPLASIERIEILSSAGSAIYGANATGGAINIITRRDYQGGQLSFRYETPADVMRPQRSVNLTYGMPLMWGMNLRLAASYNDNEPVLVGDRADVSAERFRTLALQRDPALLFSLVNNASDPGSQLYTRTLLFGATPNIKATAATGNLFASLPGAPGSNFTSVPAGYVGGSGLAAFQPGMYNLQLADVADSNAVFSNKGALGTSDQNIAFSLGLDKRINDRWRWSLDYRYGQNEGQSQAATALRFTNSPFTYAFIAPLFFSAAGTVLHPNIPAAAPGNPFGLEVQANLYDPSMSRPELFNRPRNITWGINSTLFGEVGQWRGFLDMHYSQNNVRYLNHLFVEPLQGWNAALLSGAYNPFLDPSVAAFATPEFYEDYVLGRNIRTGTTASYGSSVKASGPIVQLPAGPVQLTAGVEWSRVDRSPTVNEAVFVNSLTGEPVVPTFGTAPPGSPQAPFVFNSYAGYAEANVPVIGSKQAVRLVKRLEIFGSGRVDRSVRDGIRSVGDPRPVEYSNTSRLHAFGLRYVPVEDVALRVSRSIGFKPPDLVQVTPGDPPASTAPPTSATDPIRQEPVVITASMYIAGGNPDLIPESTNSTNIGLILTPRWLPGLRLSLDYLESTREDSIFALSAQDAINLESEIPELIERGAPDGNASGVGPITFVDRRYINLRQVASRSLDFSLQQEIREVRGGRLLLTLRATRNLSFKVQATNTGPAVEQVRNPAVAPARQIAWNGNAQLSWEGQRWGLGWNTRYSDSLLLSSSFYYVLQGGDRAPRAYDHDLNISYRSPQVNDPHGLQWLMSGTAVHFGINPSLPIRP